MTDEFVVSADIGGTHIGCCAVNRRSKQIARGSFVDAKVDSKAAKASILEAWANALQHVIETLPDNSVAGIAFAMPGPFDYRAGVAKFADTDKYESLYRVDVSTELCKILNMHVPMRFINDATAFAVGTASYGAGRGYGRIAAVTLGTGIGSAFIENGIPVTRGENVPKHGCVWHLPYRDSIADDYISTRWFEQQFAVLTGQARAGVKVIAQLANEDSEVAEIFRRYGTNLAEILIPWISSFCAEALIIGGNVAAAARHFAPALTDALTVSGHRIDVEVCSLREDAALLGAARLFDERFWEQVKDDLPEV